MIKKIIVLVGILFALVACDPAITAGKVINKDFNPGHYRTITSTTCVSRNKKGDCTMSIPNNRQEWVRPDWQLKLSNGKYANWIDVTEAVYNQYEIGACYATKTC